MKINYFIKAVVVGLSVSTLVSTSYAASRSSYSSSSSRSSYSSSSSSKSYSSSSPSSYTSRPSSSISKPSYTPSKPSATTTYKPVANITSKSNPTTKTVKPVVKSTEVKQPVQKPYPVQNNSLSSYDRFKHEQHQKHKSSNDWMTWMLLAWIVSGSSNNHASNSSVETKEIVVDCKTWLKENGHKSNDIENLSNKDFAKIKAYCEKVDNK
ncbi:hypothetical protein [Acinetobacter baumannii]|uniref:hypothetical protein n=1 Tax=Acinetobacter baumannii TaxID=470 RepID=UPI0030077B8B